LALCNCGNLELSLNHNKIEDLTGLSYLPNLQQLSFAYNKVKCVDTIIDSLPNVQRLTCINYIGNYLEEEDDVDDKLMQVFPNLYMINDNVVRKDLGQPSSSDSSIDSYENKQNYPEDIDLTYLSVKDSRNVEAPHQENYPKNYTRGPSQSLGQANQFKRVTSDSKHEVSRSEGMMGRSIDNSIFTKNLSLHLSNSGPANSS
jgi:hypothetical protein